MRQRETKAERFVRVAEQRTQRAVDAIHSLSNCASRVCYGLHAGTGRTDHSGTGGGSKTPAKCIYGRKPLYTAPISQRPRMISGASNISQ